MQKFADHNFFHYNAFKNLHHPLFLYGNYFEHRIFLFGLIRMILYFMVRHFCHNVYILPTIFSLKWKWSAALRIIYFCIIYVVSVRGDICRKNSLVWSWFYSTWKLMRAFVCLQFYLCGMQNTYTTKALSRFKKWLIIISWL